MAELATNGYGVATADSELRHVGEKKSAVCSVNLAFNRNFKRNGESEWQQEVTFMKVQVWGNRAEKMAELVKKGQPIYVTGYLKQDSWVDDDGNKRIAFLIQARDFQLIQKSSKSDNGSQVPEVAKTNSENTASPPVSDNDIPF